MEMATCYSQTISSKTAGTTTVFIRIYTLLPHSKEGAQQKNLSLGIQPLAPNQVPVERETMPSSGFPLFGCLPFGPWVHLLCAELYESHTQRRSLHSFSLGLGVLASCAPFEGV